MIYISRLLNNPHWWGEVLLFERDHRIKCRTRNSPFCNFYGNTQFRLRSVMDKLTGWKADRELHNWRTRLPLPEPSDHLSITKAREPDTMCLLTGTVPPPRCPCPKAAPEPSQTFSTSSTLSKWWRQRNKLHDRLPASQLVFQSFRSITPDL